MRLATMLLARWYVHLPHCHSTSLVDWLQNVFNAASRRCCPRMRSSSTNYHILRILRWQTASEHNLGGRGALLVIFRSRDVAPREGPRKLRQAASNLVLSC
ncbi:hypothetical protein MKEN_00498500 [Mycena kentingensis (nom. inval.)]|nr:hypothetical protein MKEN_00498500 [Mycena kentingensis (nom. inval.)]